MAGNHTARQRRTWRGIPVRWLGFCAAVATLLAVATGAALAFWTSSGSAAGTVTASSLGPATAVGATSTAGTGNVHVSWTAPTGGTAPTGYYVTRTDSSNTVVAACGTSSGATTSATSCTDSTVPLGTYTYRVVAVNHTWTATSSPSGAVTVAQAAQTITFTSTPPSNAVVNGPTYTVTATGGGSGNPVVFSSATPTVCTVSGSTVSFPHAGTCTVNADQAASTYYSAAPTAQQTFVVNKAAQIVAFTSTPPANAVVAGPTYTVTATGGASGNPVVFSIDPVSGGVCSISGATVSFQHVGTCVVDANQAGNADYLPANQVQQSIAVAKGSQAVNFTSTPPSPAQVGGSYPVTATSTSGLSVTVSLDASSTGCTLSGSTVNFVAAGTCVIDANQPGNADYLPAAQVQQSFPITKVNQTISYTSTAPSAAVVGGATYTASATATSGLTVTFSSATPSVCTSGGTNGATFTFVAAGTCTVNADQTGNGQYNAAPTATQSFTVGKGAQSISFTSTAPANATVGGATYTVTATGGASGNAVVFTIDASTTNGACTISGAVVSFVHVGQCVIDANQAGNANYNAAPQVQQSFAVGKGSQTVSFTSTAPSNATVGGATYTATATSSSGLAVTISSATTSVCTGNGTSPVIITFVGSGTCTLNANQNGNGDYNAAAQVQQSFSVTSATATHFAVSAGATQTAGQSFTLTITAQDAGNQTVPSYTGNHTITFNTTAGSSLSGATPTLPSGSVAFTNGVATVSVTLVKAETGRTITASDGTINGTSNAISVNAAAPKGLIATNVSDSLGGVTVACTGSAATWNCTGGTTTGNGRFYKYGVTLVDTFGNVATNTSGATITVTVTGSPAPSPTTLTIANGSSASSGTVTQTLPNGSTAATYTATATVGGATATLTGSGS